MGYPHLGYSIINFLTIISLVISFVSREMDTSSFQIVTKLKFLDFMIHRPKSKKQMQYCIDNQKSISKPGEVNCGDSKFKGVMMENIENIKHFLVAVSQFVHIIFTYGSCLYSLYHFNNVPKKTHKTLVALMFSYIYWERHVFLHPFVEDEFILFLRMRHA
jgi:hypothetical protein